MTLFLALITSIFGVATLFVSWRGSGGWTRSTVPIGWLLVVVSMGFWIRFGGAEFGVAYAAIALAFGAWAVIATAGRERPRGARRDQRRVEGPVPGRAAVIRTLARVAVAVPLAGAASLLASVVMVAGLPWMTANRYMFAIFVAPIVWGVLAVWAGMTTRLARTALVLAGVSALCSALLFVR